MNERNINRRFILKTFSLLSLIGENVMAKSSNNLKKEINNFTFLTGEWKIKNKRRKSMPNGDWEYFDGAATISPIMDNMVSIEELRIPPDKIFGMGIRIYDKEKNMWADHWVSAKNNVINPPMFGNFINNEAIFISEDIDNNKPIKIKSAWINIKENSCNWLQAVSYDDGKTWVENWVMDWIRK